MNQLLLKMSGLLLTGALLLPSFAACSNSKQIASSTETSVETSGEQPVDQMILLAENRYANASLEQILSICSEYYSRRTHILKTSLTNSEAATLWPVASFLEALAETYRLYPDNSTIAACYADVLDKCLDGYRVTNATISAPSGRYRDITYYNAGRGTQGDYYYDDNAWICVQYLNAYEQLGNQEYLTRAEEILEFLWTGWDDYQGGGIYWDKTYSGSKGICTNGPSAISYLWAYKITQKSVYLERAKQIYEWAVSTVRDDRGIYFAGVGDPWQPAYDQGTMMYATCLLYEIEGDEAYLTLAKESYQSLIIHIFDIGGTRKNPIVKMKRNPIYKSWCIGWLLRGISRYYTVDSKKNESFMNYMKLVLNNTLKTKDENGQYDPFFCSEGTDFWDKDYFDNEAIQVAGMTTVLALTGYWDVYLVGSNE